MSIKKLSGKTTMLTPPSQKIDRIKTEFVFIASHQLRTPLTAIKLFLEMLLDDPTIRMHPDHVEYLKNIYVSTNRMVQLVDDLLNVSRIEAGTLRVEPTSTDLKQFIQTTIDELEPIMKEKACRVRFDCKLFFRPILIDQKLMHVIIHNLLTNAIKYSHVNTCTVRVSLKKNVNTKGTFAQIRIADNGIGIPRKEQGRVFEKFFRAENALKIQTDGSGLGLYIAKMIADLSNCELGFHSVYKKGTVFTLNIPIFGSKLKVGTRSVRLSK